MCYPCPRFVPELPSPVRLRQHRDHRPGPTPPSLSRRRLPHTRQRRRRYRAADYRTPYEKLLSLPDWQKHLKDGVRAETLEQQASRHSDTAAAQRIQKAKLALLPLSPWSLIPPDFCSDRSRARGLQTPAPLPRTPHPPLPNCHRKENPSGTTLPILLLQAHSWIGKCCVA